MKKIRGRASAVSSFERSVRADLHERRWVRVHVALIGLVTFGGLWGLSHALMVSGIESMAVRHGFALLGAYLFYLGLLWLWARWLLSREDAADGLDLPDLDFPEVAGPSLRSGGGGDFGGAGAGGSFDEPVQALADKATSAAAEAVSGADDGVVVLVPLALVVGVAVLLGMALGFVVFGLFGAEILLGVAVEIALASAGGALALKAQREGWLRHAVSRTAGPMAVVLAAVVGVGLAVAHWLPQARTLPQALGMLFG